jgi:hypothetical protein
MIVGQVLPLMDERLPDFIEYGIVEVLGSKCCFVDGSRTRVRLTDHMLLN